jgi:hypothetical protein
MKACQHFRRYERLEVSGQDISHPRFMRWLRQIVTWAFALAPLVPNEFNQAKCVVKFLGDAVPTWLSVIGKNRGENYAHLVLRSQRRFVSR